MILHIKPGTGPDVKLFSEKVVTSLVIMVIVQVGRNHVDMDMVKNL